MQRPPPAALLAPPTHSPSMAVPLHVIPAPTVSTASGPLATVLPVHLATNPSDPTVTHAIVPPSPKGLLHAHSAAPSVAPSATPLEPVPHACQPSGSTVVLVTALHVHLVHSRLEALTSAPPALGTASPAILKPELVSPATPEMDLRATEPALPALTTLSLLEEPLIAKPVPVARPATPLMATALPAQLGPDSTTSPAMLAQMPPSTPQTTTKPVKPAPIAQSAQPPTAHAHLAMQDQS